jgi:hypothetical protein
MIFIPSALVSEVLTFKHKQKDSPVTLSIYRVDL